MEHHEGTPFLHPKVLIDQVRLHACKWLGEGREGFYLFFLTLICLSIYLSTYLCLSLCVCLCLSFSLFSLSQPSF